MDVVFMKRILFISGSVGLGHAARDVAIAKQLRKLNPEIEIIWLVDSPAAQLLQSEGEVVHPDAALLPSNTELFERTIGDGKYEVDLTDFSMEWLKIFPKRLEIYDQVAKREKVDLVVGDETYDICVEWYNHPEKRSFPFVMMVDFIGFQHVNHNPKTMLQDYMLNRLWCRFITEHKDFYKDYLFIGELDDVPDQKFGILLPNKRAVAKEHVHFVGYTLNFDPADYADKTVVRAKLGYGNEPLVVCSVGGTQVTKPLLDLCAEAFPIVKRGIPELRMVLVCGPGIAPESIKAVDGIEVRGFVPRLYEHLAASDLSITSGGGTTTLELTALQKPFLYFPLEKHLEQEKEVAARCERMKAGVRMTFSDTTPHKLAMAILDHLNRKVNYPRIPVDGARQAAERINKSL